MTRHDPEFLRQRSSNLSLRMAAAANNAPNMSSTPAPEPKVALKPELPNRTTTYLAVKLNELTRVDLCDECLGEISKSCSLLGQTVGGADMSTCMTCQLVQLNPAAYAKPFCTFLQDNPTIFHTVDYFKRSMNDVGFEELPARDDWTGKIQAGGKYYVTRNGSCLAAFTVGKAYKPGNGVAMIAGHIDAVTARLKPISNKPNTAGYIQLGVSPYAGGLNETWWDRDLSIGGRVVVRDDSGKTSTKLVKFDWPIARIPTLAPHFGVGVMGRNNAETEAVPVIGLEGSKKNTEPLGPAGSFTASQPPRLVELVSNQLGVSDYSKIINWELELFDLQPATLGGMDKEFLFGGRIDDKLCSWGALQALLASSMEQGEGVIKLVALFDDEEIGSLLRQGARGNFLPNVIERAVESLCTKEKPYGPGVVGQTYAKSFLVSADVTHAVNPNFMSKYLDGHAPQLNTGIVLCTDSNGHMTTDAVSTSILTRVCDLTGCTPQRFQIRNDSRSGGTVGPMLSSAMGVKAADAGMPQLSMHSMRATTGALDPGLGVKFFKGFLDNFEKVDEEWQH